MKHIHAAATILIWALCVAPRVARGAKTPAPCKAYVVVVHSILRGSKSVPFAGPTKEQRGWLRKHADKGRYTGLCYVGMAVPVEWKAFLSMRPVWHRVPAGPILPKIPLFAIEWSTYYFTRTSPAQAGHAAYNRSWYYRGRVSTTVMRGKAAVWLIRKKSVLLDQTSGLHAKWRINPPDGPALQWGMKYLSRLESER